ncbi:unnamed protein product [Phytophthora lilii]|uniref:Unnamed protein product n=1 Tax=Phytophthora lilii TaxID=2077276 RepID=A0A9W6X047_9STRA|nr:unnamed protein product [Phytophthora lilii]
MQSVLPSSQDGQRTRAGSQVLQDYESVVLVRRDLHQSKQHQARHERDVTNVINAMTNLIADQQDELDSLQHQIQDMTREIGTLKNDVKQLKIKQAQLKSSSASQKKVATAVLKSSHRKPVTFEFGADAQHYPHHKDRVKTFSISSKKKRNTVTDMDIFEKRFRLT